MSVHAFQRRRLAWLAIAAGLVLLGLTLLRNGRRQHAEESRTPPDRSDLEEQELAAPIEPETFPATDEIRPRATEPLAVEEETMEARLAVHVVTRESGAPLGGQEIVVWPDAGGMHSIGYRRVGPAEHNEFLLLVADGEALEIPLESMPTTDASGRLTFRLSPGPYRIRGQIGAARIREDLTLVSGEERELVLEVPTELDRLFVGRVRERDGGAAIADAEVLLFQPWNHCDSPGSQREGDTQVRLELARTTTDAAGGFTLRAPSWADTYVRVDTPHHARILIVPEEGHEDEAHAFEATLTYSAALELTLREHGAPAQDVYVWLTTVNAPFPALAGATSDASGRCSFEELPAGTPFTLTIERPEPEELRALLGHFYTGPSLPGMDRLEQRVPGILELDAGERRELELSLPERCRLTGVVRDQAGQTVANLAIRLARGNANDTSRDHLAFGLAGADLCRTDAGGRYQFEDLPADVWWVGPAGFGEALDERVAWYLERIEVPDGVVEFAHDLRVSFDLFLRGQVLADGLPVPDAQVCGGELIAESDAQGRFALGPVEPREYLLSARATGLSSRGVARATPGGGETLLVLVSTVGLSGTVSDASSREPFEGDAWLLAEDGESETLRLCQIRAGRLEAQGLLPALYALYACTADGRFATLHGLDLRAGSALQDIALAFEPGATVRVLFEQAPTRSGVLAVRSAGRLVAFSSLLSDRPESLVVPSGDLDFLFSGEHGEWSKSVEASVSVGQETTVVALPAVETR